MSTFLKEALSMGAGNWALILLFISIFIDVSPIKINPIRSLIKFFGNCFNSSVEREISTFKIEVNQKFGELQDEQRSQKDILQKLVLDQERRDANNLCWAIIDFNNSIQNGTKHSREQYRHILDCSDKYIRMSKVSETQELIPPEELAQILEAENDIRNHYEEKRQDRTALIF